MSTSAPPSPRRLDAALHAAGLSASRALAQKAIKSGRVTVNGMVIRKPAHVVGPADRLMVTEGDLAAPDGRILPVDLGLRVLFEDDACLVVSKPAGLAVHPGAGMAPREPTVLHGARHLFRERSIPFSPSAVLAHRLDKETTGCLLLAKTPADHRLLQKQFAARTVQKTYVAVVTGIPAHREALIDSPIGRSAANRTRMSVRGAGSTRAAKTAYRLRAADQKRGIAVLECDLQTGRTHQIRVHLAAIGHPILGDPAYATPLSRALAEELGVTHLLLHAWRLAFTSPDGDRRVTVESPLPEWFGPFTRVRAD